MISVAIGKLNSFETVILVEFQLRPISKWGNDRDWFATGLALNASDVSEGVLDGSEASIRVVGERSDRRSAWFE